ncbi:protein FAM63A isoform X2 [Biomphalaria glabrata]|nr:protein FAM63A isoform X2 [Biomphalaria glabrata]
MDDQGASKDDALESTPPPGISETASSDDHLTVQHENEAASNSDSVAASNEMELSPAASNLKHSNVIDNKLTSPECDQQGENANGTPQSETSSSSEKNVPSNHLPEQFSPSLDQLGTSLTSSPKSSSSGQDSGLSPDDSGFDISKTQSCDEPSKEPQTTKAQKEQDTQSEKVNISAGSLNSASPDTTTSASETQVTVSDLESPSAENVAAEPCSALTKSDQESVYYIKWITFGQNNVPIITQNENGPCPLLAIMNVLLLKGKVKLAPMLEMITSEQLMTHLGECILDNMPQNLSQTSQANYEQNMQDAMSVMHKLQTGLDVNVKFTGVADFEYTPELIIFDLLEISLYHGWLVDPQDSETVKIVNQDSYNQLVEKIIFLKHADNQEDVTQALIAEQFLDRTASQLTYHGLCELASVVKENEPCVFFRNNHFSTLYKHNRKYKSLRTLKKHVSYITAAAEVIYNTLAVEVSYSTTAVEINYSATKVEVSYSTTAVEVSYSTTAVEVSYSTAAVEINYSATKVEVSYSTIAVEVSYSTTAVEVSYSTTAVEVSYSTTAVEFSYSTTAVEVSYSTTAVEFSYSTTAVEDSYSTTALEVSYSAIKVEVSYSTTAVEVSYSTTAVEVNYSTTAVEVSYSTTAVEVSYSAI